MKGKTVLITGGNNGIGKATAIGLAKKGAEVIIACRNESKGKAAVADIKKASNHENVQLILCDLASFKSIQQCAKTFKSKHSKLDVLVNNAGLIVGEHKTTEEGFEYQFGVNHMGHFYLTHLLMEQIMAANEPRIVNVSSGAHYSGKLDLSTVREAKDEYSSIAYYAQSKLANILFTKGLATRFPKIKANTLHPGVVRTSFGEGDVAWYIKAVWKIMKPFLMTSEKGARTSIYLAASPLVDVSGKYFEKSEEKRPSKEAEDTTLADELWAFSEQAVKQYDVLL